MGLQKPIKALWSWGEPSNCIIYLHIGIHTPIFSSPLVRPFDHTQSLWIGIKIPFASLYGTYFFYYCYSYSAHALQVCMEPTISTISILNFL